MLRKYLLSGSLIAVLCLSGCSNGSELPGYNAKIHYSSSSMYKNDLMDKILNEKIYKATENTEVSDAAKILFRIEDMNDEARRNLNYSMWRAQYNAVTEIHIHTAKGGFLIHCHFRLSEVVHNLALFQVWQVLMHLCIHLTILLFILVYLWRISRMSRVLSI